MAEIKIHRSIYGYLFDLIFFGVIAAICLWMHLVIMANGGYLNFDQPRFVNAGKIAPLITFFLLAKYVVTIRRPRFRIEAGKYHTTSVGGSTTRGLYELKNITLYSNGFFVVRYHSGRRVWYHKCLFIETDKFINAMATRGVPIIHAN